MAALAAILLPSVLTAQITFERTYGGTGNDEGRSAQQTFDGGYVIAGYTRSFGAGGEDVYLVKTDAHGDTLWTRVFGGTGDDRGYSVWQTSDSGYVIAGATSSFGAGYSDIYLIKTDVNGDTTWTRTFGGSQRDWGYSVQQTTDGGYIVTGYTGSGAGGPDVYLIKTDADGDTLWTRVFGGASADQGYSVQQTADGGYIVAGNTCSFGVLRNDLYLVKTDANGDTIWTRVVINYDYSEGYSVQQTADNGYIVAGYWQSAGGAPGFVYLVKTDANGDTLWTRGCGGAWGMSVRQTIDGGYITAGGTYPSGARTDDVYLVRADANGDTLWTRTYGDDSADCGYSVQQVTDGGYVIAGYTTSVLTGHSDVYLIKTDSLGNVAVSVAEPKASPTRAPGLSLSCEPNPFRTKTAISLQPTANSPAELVVFDVSGRCVRTLAVDRTSNAVWDGTDGLGQPLPSGAYFMRLDAGGQHAAARVVLQR
jgi:hypothetical protein